MASGSEVSQQTLSRVDFNQVLLESVNSAVAVALGRNMTPELGHYLGAYIGLSDEMTNRIDFLFSTLRNSFGLQGDGICRLVVKQMYAKAEVPFYEIGGKPMIQYVEELKVD